VWVFPQTSQAMFTFEIISSAMRRL
jgi:hypothetical protein